MQTVITKNAQKVIDTFNKRELDIFNTGIGYLMNDMEHINNCSKERDIYKNSDPEKYTRAIVHQTNMSFRCKYLLQCLELHVYDDYETNTIKIKSLKDK